MRDRSSLFQRLVPAALATSLFAALAHAALVAIAARSIGFELVLIASLSFIVAALVALPGGALLLAVVALLKLGLVSSFLLFFVLVQLVAEYVFDRHWKDTLPPKEDVSKLADVIWRLRPLVDMAVQPEVARAMEKALEKILGDRLELILKHLNDEKQPASLNE